MSNDINIESMIESLSGDLKPLKRSAHPVWRAIVWAALVIAYVTIVLLTVGVRHDLADQLLDTLFHLEVCLQSPSFLIQNTSRLFLINPKYFHSFFLFKINHLIMDVLLYNFTFLYQYFKLVVAGLDQNHRVWHGSCSL